MSWFKRDPRPAEPPKPGQDPADPVNTINLMSRLDSVVDRLDGVSEQLLASLDRAQKQRGIKEGGSGG